MNKIQIIFDILGILSCAILTAYTGETGYLIATIWAMTSFTKDLDKYFDEL